MFSTIKYITSNNNKQFWDLGKDIGIEFENYIYKVIVKVLNATFSSEINVYQTGATRDGGRDIIIKSKKDFELFDINFSLKGKKEITIYIECKSTNQDMVSYEKFAKNTIIAGQDHVDYLLLVTNKTIGPYTYYSAFENAEYWGYEFILIDQYILYSYLERKKLNIWDYETATVDYDQITLSYQMCKGCHNRKPCFELYLLCRNYGETIAECELSLMTDRNWKLSSDKQSFLLERNKSKCIKIIVLKEFADGLDDIILHISLNEHLNVIQLEGTSLSYNFELPFTGQNHKDIISKIKNTLSTASSFYWINLYGEAGVGKTRILDELNRFFYDRSVQIINAICSKGQKISTFQSVLNITAKSLKRDLSSLNMLELLHEIEDKLLWTIIFIEDIHNADKAFLKMLEAFTIIEKPHMPIILITTGRDDYTVYNEDYFKLLEKLSNIQNNSFIFNYAVEAFKDEECINLIKRTITDIPDEALVTLHKMSKNNPFYLVQFIEYLLEIKLVNLLNRSTVGIPNILTFSEKLYVPKAIEELLNKRLENLGMFPLGEKMQFFLKSAALFGIQFPKQLLFDYFDESEFSKLEVLFRCHFIVGVDSMTLRFDHESIYLFFKHLDFVKKSDFNLHKILYQNPKVFSLYDKLKQGVILCHIDKYKEAKEYFLSPIKEIEDMDNISSENISDRYYEYFDLIYVIFRKENNLAFMKKIILAKVYVAMHNLSMGQASKSFEDAFNLLNRDYRDDESLILEVKQLQASFYLHVGMISKARGLMNDLLAIERSNEAKFTGEAKFNLFERASSLYIHSNHVQPALEYNKLAFDIADQMNNDKLKALAKINKAKLYFYSDIKKSYCYIQEAEKHLEKAMVPRIDCHNRLGKLTAEILLSKPTIARINQYILKANKLLEYSIEVNYPLDIIRAHFLLANLYFLMPEENIELSKKHINHGINASVRYGILKLMGNLYNLKALIGIYEKQNIEYIASLFDTMIEYLKQEDLLFLGNLDFSYSNIVLLTNFLIFLNEYGLESKKYEFLSQISYYGYSSSCDYQCSKHDTCKYTCAKNIEIFQKNFENVKEGSLLLVNPQYKFPFIMYKYFYPIYL